MQRLREALQAGPGAAAPGRTWIYVPYDQLTTEVGPLASLRPEQAGVVLVESVQKARRRPVHQQKLAWVLCNQRHFAVELAQRGYAVDYRATLGSYVDVLTEAARDHGPLRMMRAAERELRTELAPLVEAGLLHIEPHGGWLTTTADFEQACPTAPYRMDAFYRHVRRRLGVLMIQGKPAGGKFSHDHDNRAAWKGDPPAPEPPRFTPDPISLEVGDLIAARFADHPGRLDLTQVSATAADAERLWSWALQRCMPDFGTYEDAMSTESRGLFHTRISPLLNNLRLLPARVVRDVEQADLPLNAAEGFVRQVLGWREYVRHVHEATDGFRHLQGPANHLSAHTPLPPAFWGTPSGLACLDRVVHNVWDDGYSHHIERLMVLCNIALLLDVDPRALTDWFWAAYIDAYDWVVEPNVLGMGTFAAGDVMTTKPYIAGSGYIKRMGNDCANCAFHPQKSCPLTPMYWAFLERHDAALAGVDRIVRQLWSARKRDPEQRAADQALATRVRERLLAGERVTPEDTAR